MRFEKSSSSSKTLPIVLVVFLLAAIAALFYQHTTNVEKVEHLEEIVEQKAKAIVDLEEQLHSTKNSLETAQEVIKEANLKGERLNQVLADEKAKCEVHKRSSAELSATKAHVDELRIQISGLTQDLEESEERTGKLKAENTILLRNATSLQRDLDNYKALGKQLTELKNEAQNALRELSRAKDQIATVEQQYNHEKLLLKEEVSNLQSKCQKAEDSAKSSSKDALQVQTLKNEIETLKRKCAPIIKTEKLGDADEPGRPINQGESDHEDEISNNNKNRQENINSRFDADMSELDDKSKSKKDSKETRPFNDDKEVYYGEEERNKNFGKRFSNIEEEKEDEKTSQSNRNKKVFDDEEEEQVEEEEEEKVVPKAQPKTNNKNSDDDYEEDEEYTDEYEEDDDTNEEVGKKKQRRGVYEERSEKEKKDSLSKFYRN